ncbi:MAG: peroxiredoxin family protein [Armatimonadota bacterium]
MNRQAAALSLVLVLASLGLVAAQQVRQPLAPGTTAPDFTATTLEGATIKLADWRGKVVVLSFLITWFRDAARHIEMMEHLGTAFSEQGMRLVSISLDEEHRGLDDLRALVREHAIAHPVVADPRQQIAALYGVSALPAIFVIGRDGKIAHYHEGYTEGDDERLGAVIAAALAAGAEGEAPAQAQESPPAAAPEAEEPVCRCFRSDDQ